ncbi:MAG: hypothetical protein AB1752_11895, partial [Candidatus Zixiibacteriota bacterium]
MGKPDKKAWGNFLFGAIRVIAPMAVGAQIVCSWAFAGATSGDGHLLQRVEEPAELKYRFGEVWSWHGQTSTQLHPVDFDGDGTFESYHLQSGRSGRQS